jgi:methylated-DNA-[protein]-cysteine S-methyltransferase
MGRARTVARMATTSTTSTTSGSAAALAVSGTVTERSETSPPATLYTVVPSPVGDLTLTGTADALTGCWFDGHTKPTDVAGDLARDDDRFADEAAQLAAYFAGDLHGFALDLAPQGTTFQHRVWAQLRAIPYGETRSYGELALALGDPKLSRAVGLANGRNPLSIIVPCHRVIGADGSLTGFGGGMARKRFLLDLEAGIDTLL